MFVKDRVGIKNGYPENAPNSDDEFIIVPKLLEKMPIISFFEGGENIGILVELGKERWKNEFIQKNSQ